MHWFNHNKAVGLVAVLGNVLFGIVGSIGQLEFIGGNEAHQFSAIEWDLNIEVVVVGFELGSLGCLARLVDDVDEAVLAIEQNLPWLNRTPIRLLLK